MEFKIRLARYRDLKPFFSLLSDSLNKLFPEYTKNTIEYLKRIDYAKKDLRTWVKKRTKQLFLATAKRKKIGYLLSSKPYGGVGYCHLLAVMPEFQGNGIASTLLKTWEKQAKKDGAHKVQLWADKRNVNFYKNREYTLVGFIPDDTFGITDYLFYKTLRKSNEKNYLKDFLKKNA